MNLARALIVRTAPLLGCLLALAACGSSDAGPSSGAAGAAGASNSGTAGAAGQGDSSKLVGSFQVKLAAASDLGDANTTVVGKVYDGVTPATVIWEKPQVDGACTLTTPRVPFCSTPCGGSSACVEDDTCLAYPNAHGVGTVTVSGVKSTTGESTFAMSPISNTYQVPASVTLAYPPFADGDAVTLAASGDFFPAFSLTGKGIAPLTLTSTALSLKSAQALELAWPTAGTAKIHVKLDISHHGGSKGQIECDADDTGSISISGALVSKLLNLGIAGYPTVIVTRHTTGSAVIAPGRVDLDISSQVEQAVSIDGLTSCTGDDDCATGQTCQNDLTCK